MELVPAKINDRWELVLPDFRRDFHAARPLWEAGRLASCAERMKPGMTVYDVGAEHGDFTALYKLWVGPSGKVIPIEPSVPMWPCIRATWQANCGARSDGWIAAFASSETSWNTTKPYEGDLTLDDDGWPAMSHGEVQADPGFRHLAQETDHTPQTRLGGLPWVPDVIVLDVEGAEYAALEGCAGWFGDTRPLVYVSVHDIGEWNSLAGWYGKSVDDLHELMAGFGYAGTLLPEYGEGEHFWLYEPFATGGAIAGLPRISWVGWTDEL